MRRERVAHGHKSLTGSEQECQYCDGDHRKPPYHACHYLKFRTIKPLGNILRVQDGFTSLCFMEERSQPGPFQFIN